MNELDLKMYGCYCEDIDAELIIHGDKIKQMKVTESAQTLGVHMHPSLPWKS